MIDTVQRVARTLMRMRVRPEVYYVDGDTYVALAQEHGATYLCENSLMGLRVCGTLVRPLEVICPLDPSP